MNKNEKIMTLFDEVTFIYTEKEVKISRIVNIKNGKKHKPYVMPPAPCYIEKVSNGYRVINIDDQRLTKIFSSCDRETTLVCYLVSEETAKKIEFYVNNLQPQLTPNISFESFFITIRDSLEQQELIAAICGNSEGVGKLEFNLSKFIKMLGENSPSQSKIFRLLKSKNKNITLNSSQDYSKKEYYSYSENKNTGHEQDHEDSHNMLGLNLREAYIKNHKELMKKYSEAWMKDNVALYDLPTTISMLEHISTEDLDHFFVKFEHRKNNDEKLIKLIESVNNYLSKDNNES